MTGLSGAADKRLLLLVVGSGHLGELVAGELCGRHWVCGGAEQVDETE